MIPRRFILLGLLLLSLASAGCRPEAASTPPATEPVHPLVWDAMTKTLSTALDARSVSVSFTVTNTSDRSLRIYDVRPSCGCTTVELPSTPWILASGEKGSFRGTVDITGKHGELAKMFYVSSIPGTQTLTVVLKVPEPDPDLRDRNQQLAKTDRQAVFRGECAVCHAAPTKGLMGDALFAAACTICHGSDRRASMVPDLAVARGPRDRAFWEKWISEGKEGTLMPAFSTKQGGPLNDEQLASLLEYVTTQLASEPATP